MVNVCKNNEKHIQIRLRKMHRELDKKPRILVFPNKEKYNMMIIFRSIDWAANCEHHRVGILGKAYIGYIPNEKYYTGASKIARIVEYILNPIRYVTQEDANMKIVNMIEKELKPKGIICTLVGKHICMSYRGVKQPNADMVTSEIRGVFEEHATRAEFFELLKLKGVMSN